MPYRLSPFAETGLTEALLTLALEDHERVTVPRMSRLWSYFRNPLVLRGPAGAEGRPWYRQAQEVGLPARLTDPGARADDRARREIVIENDIAWRLQTMVDFTFGRPLTLVSAARDPAVARTIERVLERVWERSGGISLVQDIGLLGHVYGHVDLIVRDDDGEGAAPGGDPAERAPERVRVEVVEPTRGIAILDPDDYRRIRAYVVSVERETAGVRRTPDGRAERERSRCVEIISASARQRYEDGALVDERASAWTGAPVVHIQNLAQPFRYEGLGEVEPLIPLQDELNTRLSDRACRVTLQSFKMYLAKGIDGFGDAPIGPGLLWATDNPEASIESFGADADSPSERAHIAEVREAMDKVSGVPPLAGGVVRARIGNLSSANALRITLMSLLSKTARKRVTYGGGIARASRLILEALDGAGILRTDERDRDVRVEWPDPLPDEGAETLRAAEIKLRLGVPAERVLAELGYAPADPGRA